MATIHVEVSLEKNGPSVYEGDATAYNEFIAYLLVLLIEIVKSAARAGENEAIRPKVMVVYLVAMSIKALSLVHLKSSFYG